MLVGLYLIMPVIGAWLQQASRRDIRLVLYVWGVTLLLPYIKMVAPALGYTGNYGNMGILGVCDWNSYGTFYYVSGFIGYLILAYYLAKYPPQWSWKRTLAVTVPMFLGGYLITSFGYVLTQQYFPHENKVTQVNAERQRGEARQTDRRAHLQFADNDEHRESHHKNVDPGEKPHDLKVSVIARKILLGQHVTERSDEVAAQKHRNFGISCALVWIMFRFRPTRRFVR